MMGCTVFDGTASFIYLFSLSKPGAPWGTRCRHLSEPVFFRWNLARILYIKARKKSMDFRFFRNKKSHPIKS